jgi:2,4-dienoyl-CoA reductase-like NADH-dependent reductase (Old Yellow Enzyme family)
LQHHVSLLFDPLTLRRTTFRNRVWVSPMCQYSSHDGRPTDWHLVHLGAFAQGGAGLVMTEATAVVPEGRISPQDAGIWNDEQAADYERITAFVRGQGAVPGIQLAHAGRKASTRAPWLGRGYVEPSEGGWTTVGPSPIGFADWPAPRELTAAELEAMPEQWAVAAQRAERAGFEVAEIHAAHGYLLHEFLSPLTNRRDDAWGGDLAGRSRLLLGIVDAVRAVWPDDRPLFVRLSATEWVEGGLDVDDVARVAATLKAHGVDLVDVSSGGNQPQQQIEDGPGYQVRFASTVKQVSGLPVAAVGRITEPRQAEKILVDGEADAVFLARELLRDPHWAQAAADELGAETYWPEQYLRARP